MGKSKRIRSDRARQMVDSPDKFEKVDSAKKARLTTIVLVCVLAAIIVATATLVILDRTGTFLRSTVVFESDNFKIDAIMTTYMYNSAYSAAYPTYGSITSYLINKDYIKGQAEEMLVLCEAAKAAGHELSDFDLIRIDKSIENIKETVKDSGYSLGQLYGQGVTLNDIKTVLELQMLASSFSGDKTEALRDGYLGSPEKIAEYYEKNKTSLLEGGYVSAATSDAEWREKLAKADSPEAFKSLFIELYTDANFVKKYQGAEGKDAEKVAVSLLQNLAKAAADAIDFVINDVEVKGKDDKVLDLDDDSTVVTEKMIKTIYEAKYKDDYKPADGETGITEITDAIYKAASTAADSVRTAIKNDLKENTAYTYPNKTDVSKDDYNVTEGSTSEGETTPAETTTAGTTAGTTAAGTTTAVDTTPATPDELNAFDTWFFSGDRKENEVFTEDKNKIYFVIEPAVKNEEKTVNVGHILISVESHDHEEETTDAAHKAEEEQQLAEAKAKAEQILAEFKAGNMTKEAFEELAKKNTDDSGMFYYNVQRETMVEEFDKWIYDEARKVGDTDIVKTDYGFHIMYFMGEGCAAWQATALDKMVSEEITEWTEGLAKVHAVKTSDAGLKKIFG